MIKKPIEQWWQRAIISAGILVTLGVAYNWLRLTVFDLSSRQFGLLLDAVPQWWSAAIQTQLIALEIIVAPLAGQWLSVSVPISLGTGIGAVTVFLGTVIGHSVAFMLSRVCWQPLAKHLLPHERYQSYNHKLHYIRFELGLLYALPLFPVEALTWVIGATTLRWQQWLVVMITGSIIKTIIVVSFSSQLALINYAAILLPSLGLIILSILIRWIWQRRRP